MILLVTYDLKGPSAHYSRLYDLLKSQQGWSHYLASTWLIHSNKTAQQLSEEIRPLLLPNDFFLVVRFSQEYWGWMPKEAWDWVSNHLRQ